MKRETIQLKYAGVRMNRFTSATHVLHVSEDSKGVGIAIVPKDGILLLPTTPVFSGGGATRREAFKALRKSLTLKK